MSFHRRINTEYVDPIEMLKIPTPEAAYEATISKIISDLGKNCGMCLDREHVEKFYRAGFIDAGSIFTAMNGNELFMLTSGSKNTLGMFYGRFGSLEESIDAFLVEVMLTDKFKRQKIVQMAAALKLIQTNGESWDNFVRRVEAIAAVTIQRGGQ